MKGKTLWDEAQGRRPHLRVLDRAGNPGPVRQGPRAALWEPGPDTLMGRLGPRRMGGPPVRRCLPRWRGPTLPFLTVLGHARSPPSSPQALLAWGTDFTELGLSFQEKNASTQKP